MIIKVCVGTACHLKGSYHIIHGLQDLIDKHQLGDKVFINPAFCLGECSDAVSVDIGEEKIYSLKPNQLDNFFETIILPKIKKE
jgi:NADH:ubiquinone oxidoreductase subunit E